MSDVCGTVNTVMAVSVCNPSATSAYCYSPVPSAVRPSTFGSLRTSSEVSSLVGRAAGVAASCTEGVGVEEVDSAAAVPVLR